MLHRSRMITISIVSFGLLITACSSSTSKPTDRKVSANKTARADSTETRPEWAYDQPEYVKPVNDLTPEPTARPTDPLHYFTNQQTILVRQPGGYEEDQIPRVALWTTNDNGWNWYRQGYFGRGQSYFTLQVKDDGDYGVRFVGPGQVSPAEVPAEPVRVYHVDSCMPEVEVWIEPEQTWYNVGDTVTIAWRATDPNLVEFPVRIGMTLDFTADDGRSIELHRDLANEGSLTYVLPQETFDHEVWFRVEAMDRANNLGAAYSFALQVVDTDLAATEELKEEVKRVSSADVVTQEQARAMLDKAAAEYDALLAAMVTTIRDAARRGDEIRRSQEDNQPSRVAATEVKAPVFGRFESTDIATASDDDATADELAMIDKEPCEDGTVTETPETIVADNSNSPDGPMSDASGPLPYATAASREVMDADVANENVAAIEANRAEIPTVATETEVFEAQAKPFAYEQPTVTDSVTKTSEFTSFDPTCGNGVLVPLPATVETHASHTAHAHPWRALGARRMTTLIGDNIWTLPGRRGNFGWQVEFEGRFLADNPTMRNIALPPSMTPTYADVEADMDGLSKRK